MSCLSPGGSTSYYAVNQNEVNGHVQNILQWNYAKNYRNRGVKFKKLGI